MDTRHFHKHLFDRARALFGEERMIVLAVSGGADSMALLHGLARVNELRRCNWQLHVAHLDHGVPHNATAMCDFVGEHAQALGLPFHRAFIDVPRLARDTGESIEEAGRKARYQFLATVCEQVGAKRLVTAHHAEDQAETVLFRLLRGTGLRGLRGMRPVRPLIDSSDVLLVRPMLGLRRADGVAYLKTRQISFMHDDTNDDITAGRRNYIRHVLMPDLAKHLNPQAVTALGRIAEQQAGAWDYLQQQIDDAWQDVCIEQDETHVSLDATHLSDLHPWLIAALLYRAAIDVAAGQKTIDADAIERCRQLLQDAQPRTVELAGAATAHRRGRFLEFRRADEALRANATNSVATTDAASSNA